VGAGKLRVTTRGNCEFQQPSITLGAEVEISAIFVAISEDSQVTGFRFIFPDDDEEGFEVLEENEASADDDEDGEEEPTQISNEDDVIWETEEED
jgi:hypothetical protein